MILHPYKIVFSGSMGAGKSAAIQALSDIPVFQTEAINTDTESHVKMLTTVGIDYGEFSLDDGTKVGLYGTPGQQRFDFIWSVICQGALGTIVLIDHTAENPLTDLKLYLDTFSQNNQNLIVAITHVDEKSDMDTIQYRDFLANQPRLYPLFFIDAREREDILLLIDALISRSEIFSTLEHAHA